MKGPIWCTVRQQAWTEELHIVSTCVLHFCDFLISRPSFQKGLILKHRYYQLDIKDQYLIWLQQTPLHFCHRLCLMESCVSTPKWQKEQREKTKGRNETQLHTETTGNKVTWTCWVQMSLSTWSSKRMRSTAVQATRKTRGQTTPQAWRQEKAQTDTKKV